MCSTLGGKLSGILSRHDYLVAFAIYGSIASVYAIMTDGVLRDDAYIFFTYARNLAESGVLSFNPGEASFGVTSIAWTGLLAGGTALIHDPVLVAKILGVLLGAGGTVLWTRWFCRQLSVRFSVAAVAFAALLPNIGADRMVTGMETGLLCCLSGLLLNVLASATLYRPWLAGGVLGLLVLTRPELILALLMVLVLLLLSIRENVITAVKVLATAGLASIWFAYLFVRTGYLLPPTMRGKLSVFLPEHLGITVGQFESGSLVSHMGWAAMALRKFMLSGVSEVFFILLLGATAAFSAWAFAKRRDKKVLLLALPPAVAIVFTLLYVLTFPLLQLRYFVWMVPQLAISLFLSSAMILPGRYVRVSQIGVLVLCLTLQPFALARRVDSTNVQQMRRNVAELINRVTPREARIALEPIGEIGFYGDRYIVDMGGITDSRVQNYLARGYADVSTIWQCLEDFDADYLVTYDDAEFLGRLPRDFADRFELVTYIPEQPVRGIRYRLLRILKN